MRWLDGKRRIVRSLVLLALPFLVGPAIAAHTEADSTEIEADWVVQVDSLVGHPIAIVISNRFSKGGTTSKFPFRVMPIMRNVDHSIYRNEDVHWDNRLEVALLGVKEDGSLTGQDLKFVEAPRIAADRSRLAPTFIALSDSDYSTVTADSLWAENTLRFNAEGIPGDRVGESEVSPDRSYAIVRSGEGTYMVFGDEARPPISLCLLTSPFSFSANGDRLATVSYVDALRNYFWLVADRYGKTVRAGALTSSILSSPHLSADGGTLMFAQTSGKPEQTRTVVIDLRTGKERSSPIASGTRYFSANGRTMAVLQTDAMHLYDVKGRGVTERGARNPAASSFYFNAAVSDDGGLVAIESVDRTDTTRDLRVELLDRSLAKRLILRHCPPGGLTFSGRYLIVGTQQDPLYWIQGTRSIRVYDLSRY